MVPKASLDGFGEKKISILLQGFEPWTTQPVASCYTMLSQSIPAISKKRMYSALYLQVPLLHRI